MYYYSTVKYERIQFDQWFINGDELLLHSIIARYAHTHTHVPKKEKKKKRREN